MTTNEGWTFKDRSFLLAIGISLAWHFFWFFLIQITVVSSRSSIKIQPKVVALGPVLDDTIFKMLVETKPQFSETFYRRLSDYSSTVEPSAQTMPRHEVGAVVSLPFGKKINNAVRHLLGGDKLLPSYEFTRRIKMRELDEGVSLEGEIKHRQILNRPEKPQNPPGIGGSLKSSELELELEFIVQPSGVVTDVQTLVSSGDSELDDHWIHYLKEWQFAPLALKKLPTDQKGKVTFRLAHRLPEDKP